MKYINPSNNNKIIFINYYGNWIYIQSCWIFWFSQHVIICKSKIKFAKYELHDRKRINHRLSRRIIFYKVPLARCEFLGDFIWHSNLLPRSINSLFHIIFPTCSRAQSIILPLVNTSDFLLEKVSFQFECVYLEMCKGDWYRKLVTPCNIAKTYILNALKKYRQNLLEEDSVCFNKRLSQIIRNECPKVIFM